mgnify:CR=1 FL=1
MSWYEDIDDWYPLIEDVSSQTLFPYRFGQYEIVVKLDKWGKFCGVSDVVICQDCEQQVNANA